MFGKFTTALAAALVLASASVTLALPRTNLSRAQALATVEEEGHYYKQHLTPKQDFCYLPGDPCDNEHRLEN